jgi:hypothetical protein
MSGLLVEKASEPWFNGVHLAARIPFTQRLGGFHRKITERPRLAGGVCLTLVQRMKRAFVIRLSPETNPAEGTFQGHVEEVDTGRELRFRSLEEFLAFLQECLANKSVDQ